jgi:hypothetical protein
MRAEEGDGKVQRTAGAEEKPIKSRVEKWSDNGLRASKRGSPNVAERPSQVGL